MITAVVIKVLPPQIFERWCPRCLLTTFWARVYGAAAGGDDAHVLITVCCRCEGWYE